MLNAKQHEREAEIVAQAGKQGAVTIATNMAGRGTDIMLGGNVTYMAKAALKKELTKELTKDLDQRKDEYEHAKARAKATGAELPTPPEADIDAKLEMLLTECDGHADTEDTEVLAARKRLTSCAPSLSPKSSGKRKPCVKPAVCSSSAPSATRAAASTTSCAAVPAVRVTRVPPASS